MTEPAAKTAGSRHFLSGYAGRMLVATALGWGVLQTGRFLMSAVLPTVIADLSITPFQAGLALTIHQALYAVTQFPSGRFSDQLSRLTLIVPALAGMAAALLLVAGSPGFVLFLLGVSLFGLGKGTFTTPTRALVADLYVGRRGRALGLFGIGSDLGGVAASAIGAAVVLIGWRAPFVLVALLLVVTLVALHHWSRETYVFDRVSLDLRGTTGRLVSGGDVRRLLIAYVIFYFAVNGIISFLPTLLQVDKGFSPGLASAAFALLFAIGILVKPLAGALSDRVPRVYVGVVGFLLGAAALVAVSLGTSTPVIVAGIALFAVGYKAQLPVVDALLLDAAPDANIGGDLGAAKAAFTIVGSLGPAYIGFVASRLDYSTAFASIALGLLLGAALLVWALVAGD